MSTFWLGAGAAAALILAILGVLQYARSGSNLLVSVRQYEFELPATAQQAFAKLAERISPWSDEPLVGIDDEVAGGVEAVLKVFGIRVGPRLRIFWKIMLRNRGREPAQAVELHVPEAVQIEVRRGSMGDGVPEESVVLRLTWLHWQCRRIACPCVGVPGAGASCPRRGPWPTGRA